MGQLNLIIKRLQMITIIVALTNPIYDNHVDVDIIYIMILTKRTVGRLKTVKFFKWYLFFLLFFFFFHFFYKFFYETKSTLLGQDWITTKKNDDVEG